MWYMETQDVIYYYPSLSYDVAGSNHRCYKLQAEAEPPNQSK